jgi:hypothetical protein
MRERFSTSGREGGREKGGQYLCPLHTGILPGKELLPMGD